MCRGAWLIAPPALYAFLLLALPLGAVVVLSFFTQDYLTIVAEPTLTNYREAATEPLYRQLLLRSLGIAGSVGDARSASA